MYDISADQMTESSMRAMAAVTGAGLQFMSTSVTLGDASEHLTYEIGLNRPDTPTGVVGLALGWTAKVPSGRYIAAKCEIKVAVDSACDPDERARIRGVLTPIVEFEVTSVLDVVDHVHVEGDIRLLTENTFYDTLIADIAAAQRSVLILAPYLGYRIEAVMPELVHACQRGLKVTLVIKPENNNESASQFLNPLREAGAAIVERSNDMHEKLVIIDEAIVMHGSLNTLSHEDTTESMIRFPSATLGRSMTVLYHPESGQSYAERQETIIDNDVATIHSEIWGIQDGSTPPIEWLMS